MPVWNSATHKWEGGKIGFVRLGENGEQAPSDPDLDALIAWFRANRTRLPTTPYILGDHKGVVRGHREVCNPARLYEFLESRIADGVKGQVAIALKRTLERLREKFGEEFNG